MDYFILRNTRTGWQGSVTGPMYRRLIAKAEYEDPRLPFELPPEKRAFEVVKPAKVEPWQVVERSPGWYDVARNGETKNEKAMRKAAAEKLAEKLNAE
ncbi:MAG TPA: hypothetical protein VKN76_12100 [Kiloniellaceae bacterium]|nr:hypothetical protein [Kiloniellaceae bacterium]